VCLQSDREFDEITGLGVGAIADDIDAALHNVAPQGSPTDRDEGRAAHVMNAVAVVAVPRNSARRAVGIIRARKTRIRLGLVFPISPLRFALAHEML
jgi:hypothetical protein